MWFSTFTTTLCMLVCLLQIRKSEKNLLERLFTVIHHLTPVQLETLLKEEDSIVKCRKEARAALEDCKQAIFVVSNMCRLTPICACVVKKADVSETRQCDVGCKTESSL